MKRTLCFRTIFAVLVYFLLGAGAMGFLLTTPLKKKYCFMLSLVFCVFFAATDEYHQFLLGTRNGNALDVLLDSMGAMVGVSAIGAWKRIRK